MVDPGDTQTEFWEAALCIFLMAMAYLTGTPFN